MIDTLVCKDNEYGYYDGPPGVFYHPKEDVLFELEYHHASIFNWKLQKETGKLYYYRNSKSKRSGKTAISGMDNSIYLGVLD